jgi:leucyl aminopeptidase (aminopeptidase T)
VTIRTGVNYSLTLDLSDRQWFVDDGCGDFPAGEIYIAPREEGSNGDLLVSSFNFQGQIYKDVEMTFEHGKLTRSSCKELDDFLTQRPDNFSVLCEFGIGLNPRVKGLTGYTPIDEKALGTYHIALGMNHLFGGENECPFHLDFVFYADDIVFS